MTKHVYEKAGVADSGYLDKNVPDSYNVAYRFENCNDKPEDAGIRIISVEEVAEKKADF